MNQYNILMVFDKIDLNDLNPFQPQESLCSSCIADYKQENPDFISDAFEVLSCTESGLENNSMMK